MKTSRVQNIICLDPSSPVQFRKGGKEGEKEGRKGRERGRKEMFLRQIGIETELKSHLHMEARDDKLLSACE